MKAQGFHFVTMHELQENWGKHPAKTVAITFDDGYLDNLQNAYPILEKYQAKATIYVVVDRHDRDWSTYKKPIIIVANWHVSQNWVMDKSDFWQRVV